MKEKIKKHYKFILGIVVGLVLSSLVAYAATAVASKDITYDNSQSGLSATNVKDALDETYEKVKTHCPDGYNCIKMSFADDSWKTIAANVKAGKGTGYIVGDTKTVDMGELGVHTVRVANTSSCTNGETSETACGFVVEFADIITTHKMNSTATNVGGWPASEMRSYVNSTIYSALPSDLQEVIASTTVVSSHGSTSGEGNFTSTDKLYLLSTKEVWGKEGTSNAITKDTAESETRQLDYYKNNGVTTSNYSGAIKQNNGSNTVWWLRSAYSRHATNFFRVSNSGDWYNTTASDTFGVSPAFRIA